MEKKQAVGYSKALEVFYNKIAKGKKSYKLNLQLQSATVNSSSQNQFVDFSTDIHFTSSPELDHLCT